jgi:hypothetical protein
MRNGLGGLAEFEAQGVKLGFVEAPIRPVCGFVQAKRRIGHRPQNREDENGAGNGDSRITDRGMPAGILNFAAVIQFRTIADRPFAVGDGQPERRGTEK